MNQLRELAPQVLGVLVRRYGDFAAAEDAVQEAMMAAAAQWPEEGVPHDPRAWLIRVASRRLANQFRAERARRRREDLAASWAMPTVPDPAPSGDDALLVMLMCCHPALSSGSAIPLTLRAVGGLTTREIAAAFLVPEATMAQRISRAKTLRRPSASPACSWPRPAPGAGRPRACWGSCFFPRAADRPAPGPTGLWCRWPNRTGRSGTGT